MFKKVLLGLISMVASVSAFAAPIDLSALTAAVDFSSVSIAVLAIAGLLAAVFVAIKGAKIALSMLKGG